MDHVEPVVLDFVQLESPRFSAVRVVALHVEAEAATCLVKTWLLQVAAGGVGPLAALHSWRVLQLLQEW